MASFNTCYDCVYYNVNRINQSGNEVGLCEKFCELTSANEESCNFFSQSEITKTLKDFNTNKINSIDNNIQLNLDL